MAMVFSIAQNLLSAILLILCLIVVSAVARLPGRTGRGIAAGVTIGFIIINAAAATVAFLAYVLPLGQIDFWLRNLLGVT